jgi:ribosomal protein S18 acetylase RimI-like enzyme
MSMTITERSTRKTVIIRRARSADVPHVIELDAQITGFSKSDYWHDAFASYGEYRPHERFFLVATPANRPDDSQILGFILGEIRAWEFGSEPCGWVFALSVKPDVRLHGVAQALFADISAKFKEAGATKMRTMVARDNRLHLLFFRGEGMMAGPYIQLEKDLDEESQPDKRWRVIE